MGKIESKDYHDYFIKEGVFIGEFEQMYQNVEDPWHIETLGRRLDMDAALTLLRHHRVEPEQTLDIGCGQGFFTHLLLEGVPGTIRALDVSATAIEKARKKYPHPRLKFFVFDLNRIQDLPVAPKSIDLVVFSQTIWCVLPKLKEILTWLPNLLRPGGRLLISQHFLLPGQQKYGNEIMETPGDLMKILDRTGWTVTATMETNRFTNHHLAILAEPGQEVPDGVLPNSSNSES